MQTFSVVLEFEVPAETPLEAAKVVQDWLNKSKNNEWQSYVQGDEDKKVYSVDLEEADSDACLDVTNEYEPLIPKP